MEVNCETDFVAKTDVFKKFVKELSMHIAALNPLYLTKGDIPKEIASSIDDLGQYEKDACLMEQLFVKDNTKTIDQYLKEIISQTGENIIIKRFVRFSLGEDKE